MHRELQNMSEESLQNLEEIVEMELLTVEDIRNRLDVTEKGKIRQSIQNCKYALEHDPCLKGAICRNEMTCQIDIMKKMPWKRRGVHMTDTDMNNLALYADPFLRGRGHRLYWGSDEDAHDGSYPQAV